MTIQVQELIEKIKNEGVGAAEVEAKRIISEAEEKGDRIIKDAQARAEAHRKQAGEEIKKQEAASRDALKQAARDVVIGLEKDIIARFDAIIAGSAGKALTPSLTEKIILELAKSWAEKGEQGITLVLSSRDAGKLEEGLREELSRTFKEGVEIVPSARFSKGFRIGGPDGALYNFTREGIAEVLAEALSPRLAATLKEAME